MAFEAGAGKNSVSWDGQNSVSWDGQPGSNIAALEAGAGKNSVSWDIELEDNRVSLDIELEDNRVLLDIEKIEAELNDDIPTTQHAGIVRHVQSMVVVSEDDENLEAELNGDIPTTQHAGIVKHMHVGARRDPWTGSECADDELGDVERRGEW